MLSVSLENIITDVNELEKGMEQAKKECERGRDMRSVEGQSASAVLKDFLSNSEEKLKKVSGGILGFEYSQFPFIL